LQIIINLLGREYRPHPHTPLPFGFRRPRQEILKLPHGHLYTRRILSSCLTYAMFSVGRQAVLFSVQYVIKHAFYRSPSDSRLQQKYKYLYLGLRD